MLCSYHSGNPCISHRKTLYTQGICWLLIMCIVLGPLLAASSSLRRGSTGSIPTHSNFFRSVFRGTHRVVVSCGDDPSFCLDHEKNPWGGNTCCFQKFCKDIKNDVNNCGACGRVCAYEFLCCDGKCVDIRNDPRHCGACFQECPGENRCSYAMCDYGG